MGEIAQAASSSVLPMWSHEIAIVYVTKYTNRQISLSKRFPNTSIEKSQHQPGIEITTLRSMPNKMQEGLESGTHEN